MQSPTQKYMQAFERWLDNERLNWYDLNTDEDEFGTDYYTSIETDRAFAAFVAGHKAQLAEPEHNEPVIY